ncbi:MAG: NAD(P)/FAD-dependent oxidoreductase [Christensenellales bacterium]|jgi:predicted Rossmann fold flavoprotein
MIQVVVVGCGAAGMMAAYAAADRGRQVWLLDKNEKAGKKLFITGKGRCNITNTCDRDEFFKHIVTNSRFLYSSFHQLDNMALISLLESRGLTTKVERGGRVFPVSDKSSDVIKVLQRMAEQAGVKIRLRTPVCGIRALEHGGFSVALENGGQILCENVILCTGGRSYPSTGSTGDGYAWAESLGHTIVEQVGTLVSIRTLEDWPAALSGLTLKNVTLTAFLGKKRVFFEQGELLFTHSGISGPLVLSASCYLAGKDPADMRLFIDLKPALDEQALDNRVLRDFEKYKNKDIVNGLRDLLPGSMAQIFPKLLHVLPDRKIHDITREQRRGLVRLLKQLPLGVAGFAPVEEAVVTRGGVAVAQVNPQTMESKLRPGLYFAGEVLDVDALTGGYNLQIAFSTGFVAGSSV